MTRLVLSMLAATTLAVSAHAGEPVPFAGCGTITFGPQSCMTFLPDTGGGFLIENTGGFGFGDRAYVDGFIEDLPCFPLPRAPTLVSNTIAPCFAECLALTGVTQGCVVGTTDDGSIIAIESTAGMFPPGRVFVSGRLVEPPALFCFPFPGPGVADNVIGPCFEACGTIVRSVECVELETDDGARYVLDSIGIFQVGDRVRVQGILEEPCLAICQDQAGCVRNNTTASARADLDCDGEVGFRDLTALLAGWGPCPPGPCLADLDGDELVGFTDLATLLSLWSA